MKIGLLPDRTTNNAVILTLSVLKRKDLRFGTPQLGTNFSLATLGTLAQY
jgi:hypothetical protein